MRVLFIVKGWRTIKHAVVHLHGHSLLTGLCRCSDERGSRGLLLPIEGGSLHGRLASVAKLLLPSWVDLIGILLKSEERTLKFLMRLGVLDHTIREGDLPIRTALPLLPSILALGARDRTLLWSILVAERAATGSEDHIAVAQVLEECWQSQGVHASRDDGSCLRHALPFLVVVWAIGLVVLKHEGNVLVAGITLHLAKAHGAHVDAAGTNDTTDLGVHKGSVTTLSLGAGHCTVSGTVVVQELLREDAAADGHTSATSNVSVDQESSELCQGAELSHHILATCNHLNWVISSDVGREELGLASL